MSKTQRLYDLHNILSQRRTPISRQDLMAELGCSQATLYRLIADLRDHLGAPLEVDEERRGFYYARYPGVRPFELPGVWISSDELRALMSAKELLANVQPGLMDQALTTLQGRIEKLLDAQGVSIETQSRRIRIIHQASRLVSADQFQPAVSALIERRRLKITYEARGSGETTVREISPQRLTSYRHNWYLDAWCHLRKGLRSFALEKILKPETLTRKARSVPDADLNQHYASAYGIFSGPASDEAVIRFSPRIARWVADELWHSRQQGEWLEDGCYELRLPLGHLQELAMDVLRYGPEAQVMAPPALVNRVRDLARETAARYADDPAS
ncbi:MAG: transcriptional regulator [Pseudomonadota bacterium]